MVLSMKLKLRLAKNWQDRLRIRAVIGSVVFGLTNKIFIRLKPSSPCITSMTSALLKLAIIAKLSPIMINETAVVKVPSA